MRKQYPFGKDFNKYTEKFESYIQNLKASIFPATDILKKGVGEETFKKLIEKDDFKGAYAFWEGEEVVYVGISKNVITRLFQHLKGGTHFSSTFPIKIMRIDDGNTKERKDITKEQIEDVVKTKISKMHISFVEIEPEKNKNKDTELYLFEVYAAINFEAKYNSFETRENKHK